MSSTNGTQLSTSALAVLRVAGDSSGKDRMPESVRQIIEDSRGADSEKEISAILSALGNSKEFMAWLEEQLSAVFGKDIDLGGKLDRPSEARAAAKWINDKVADLPRSRRDDADVKELLALADWLDGIADTAKDVDYRGVARRNDLTLDDGSRMLAVRSGSFVQTD